jgi:hypothetical protein
LEPVIVVVTIVSLPSLVVLATLHVSVPSEKLVMAASL